MENVEKFGQVEQKQLNANDQEVVDKLRSLGINFDYSLEDNNRLTYNFYNTEKLGDSCFLIETEGKRVIYQALHFSGDKFQEPHGERSVLPIELVQYLSNKFPDADNVIVSCCNPDKVRAILKDVDGKIIFIGNGFETYSTWYFKMEKRLSSVRNVV